MCILQPLISSEPHFDEKLDALESVESFSNPFYGTSVPSSAEIFAKRLATTQFYPFHQACLKGHLDTVKSLAECNNKLCLLKDKYGRTALHIAAMKGRVDTMTVLLNACPDSVKEVTATGETCLHTAVLYNKYKVIQHLVKWFEEKTNHAYLINGRDCSGNTALHLATSRKQLQTLKILLTSNPVVNKLEVNAMNNGGFTALDILYVLPHCGKIYMEIDKILHQTGALRAKDITKHKTHRDSVYDCGKKHHKPSHMNTTEPIIKSSKEYAYNVLLVTATLLAAITYQATFSPPGGTCKEGYIYNYDTNGTLQLRKLNSIITWSFIWFNSTAFIASLAMIIFLLEEFPLKPWTQISVSTLFGSHMCSIMAISPSQAYTLLFLVSAILLLVAAGKLFGFARQRSYASFCNVGS